MRVRCLIAIASVAGCAAATTDRPYVTSLELRGVRNVSQRELRRGLATKPDPWWRREKRPFDELELARDRMRVERFYEEKGYYAAKVTLAEARPSARGLDVVIAVQEGAATLIGDVKVMGVADLDDQTRDKVHKAQLGLRRGQVFHHADYERFKGDVLRVLRQHGYPNAEIAGRVDVTLNNEANVTLEARP
jgi:translocation and assembly module TamA